MSLFAQPQPSPERSGRADPFLPPRQSQSTGLAKASTAPLPQAAGAGLSPWVGSIQPVTSLFDEMSWLVCNSLRVTDLDDEAV